jgi:hypothetical protein
MFDKPVNKNLFRDLIFQLIFDQELLLINDINLVPDSHLRQSRKQGKIILSTQLHFSQTIYQSELFL